MISKILVPIRYRLHFQVILSRKISLLLSNLYCLVHSISFMIVSTVSGSISFANCISFTERLFFNILLHLIKKPGPQLLQAFTIFLFIKVEAWASYFKNKSFICICFVSTFLQKLVLSVSPRLNVSRFFLWRHVNSLSYSDKIANLKPLPIFIFHRMLWFEQTVGDPTYVIEEFQNSRNYLSSTGKQFAY